MSETKKQRPSQQKGMRNRKEVIESLRKAGRIRELKETEAFYKKVNARR